MPRTLLGGGPAPTLVALILACTLAPLPAEAGRRAFLFVYDTEIVPEGDVELEQWWWSESRIPRNNDRPNGRPAWYWIWSAPVIGLSNHLELSFPFQIFATSTTTSLQQFSAEAYYRFYSREKEGGFQPLVRLSYHHAIAKGGPSTVAPSTVETDVVLGFGKPNQLHLVVNATAEVSLPWPEGQAPLPRPFLLPSVSGGVSYPLVPGGELRLSAEALAEFQVSSQSTSIDFPRYFVGGALSWTRGRVWITAGTLVGLTGLSSASPPFIPRLLWAVAL